MPPLDLSNYVFVPDDKGVVITKDGELEFMAMAKTIIQMSIENHDMENYLSNQSEVLI